MASPSARCCATGSEGRSYEVYLISIHLFTFFPPSLGELMFISVPFVFHPAPAIHRLKWPRKRDVKEWGKEKAQLSFKLCFSPFWFISTDGRPPPSIPPLWPIIVDYFFCRPLVCVLRCMLSISNKQFPATKEYFQHCDSWAIRAPKKRKLFHPLRLLNRPLRREPEGAPQSELFLFRWIFADCKSTYEGKVRRRLYGAEPIFLVPSKVIYFCCCWLSHR